MNVKPMWTLCAVLLCWFGVYQQGEAPNRATKQGPAPLILEKNEGEGRVFRPRPDRPRPETSFTSFTLKVDPENGRSEHFVVLTEVMPPGDVIPTHRHPNADELLILESGTARVTLGDQVQEAHAGAIVFIPSGTWIGVENIGQEPLSSVGVLSAPGFEKWLRAVSAKKGEKIAPLSQAELEQARKLHAHDVIYR